MLWHRSSWKLARWWQAAETHGMQEGSAASALWTFPTVIASAIMIAWAAESAQFLISQGLALAILAWLQTLPEFAVEAVISWTAGKDPDKVHLIIANFTGSVRLLVGLGWPLIFFTAFAFNRKKYKRNLVRIELDREHCVEVLALFPPIVYFVYIYLKGTLNLLDSAALIFMYFAYLMVLNKIPPQAEEKIEELEYVPRRILQSPKPVRNAWIAGLFLAGGLILLFVAHPFLYSMLALAATLGVSEFYLVQWLAPFLSEFPEKVSAFYWARRIKFASMALMNMVSSNINQWTMLAAMLPMVYSWSRGEPSSIHFDAHQEAEILLTIAQSLLGMLLLANMEFHWYEAGGIFVLWAIQFIVPGTHEAVTVVYFAWSAVEMLRSAWSRRWPKAIRVFPALVREHW